MKHCLSANNLFGRDLICTQQIREQETITGKRHIPLVALTAHQTEDNRYDFSVFDRVLNKPISLDKLNELVNILVR